MTNETMKEKLVAVANLLADLTRAVAEIAAEFGEVKRTTQTPEGKADAKPETKPSEKTPTLEEVRAVLADISRGGKTAEMKALLGKFGANKLSDVDPKNYAALLEAAKEVTDA